MSTAVGIMPQLKSLRRTQDPVNGPLLEYTYEGIQSGIELLEAGYALGGARTNVSHVGPVWTLFVSISNPAILNPGVEEVPIDKWNFHSEFEMVDLLSHPISGIEAGLYISRAQYSKDIKDAVRDGTTYPLGASFVWGQKLYNWLSGGTKAYRVKRIVLSRNRVVTTSYVGQVVLDAVEKVWTSAALVREFNIPNAIAIRMPSDPPIELTPVDTTWGWVLAIDDSEFNLPTNRVNESKQWVFAAWLTDVYTIVT